MSVNKNVVLKFPDMYMLWRFAQKLTCTSIEINPPNNTLICDLSEEDMHFAVTNYNAKIVEKNIAMITS